MGEPGPSAADARAHAAEAAPPTRPGEVVMPRGRPAWPAVIGVLCIVFGGLGALYAVIGVVQSFMFRFMWASIPPEELPGAQEAMRGPATLGAVAWGLELLLAGLHIYGGILLLQRIPRARGAVLLFAWLDIGLNLLGGLVQYQLTSAMMGSMPDAAQAPPPGFLSAFRAMAVAGGVLSAVITSIWPVFLLIWFSRRAVRDTVREWRGVAPAAGTAGGA